MKELRYALHGRVTDHHRFRLRLHLAQYDALAEAIAALDKEIDAAIGRIDEEREYAGQAPFRAASCEVSEVPGINLLESVREHHFGLHSFRSMRRMEARRRKASALWLRHSQSFASRRQRPSQANVRSTIQRLGSATKPAA